MISCTFKISQILITSTDCLTKALPSGHQSTGRGQEVQPQSLAVPCALMLAACMVIQAWQILIGHAVGNLKLWLFEAWCISGHRYVAAVGPFQPSYAVVTTSLFLVAVVAWNLLDRSSTGKRLPGRRIARWEQTSRI